MVAVVVYMIIITMMPTIAMIKVNLMTILSDLYGPFELYNHRSLGS